MARDVIHLTFSSSGGAGRVASQLSESQTSLGWNAQLVTGTKQNLHEAPFSLPLHTLAASLDNYGVKKSGFPSLISLTRDRLNLVGPERLSPTAIVHLHWINGLVDLARLAQNVKQQPVVWTLHDMNPFTGTCHQAFSCNKFQNGCQECPAVKALAWGAVEKNLSRKVKTIESFDNLTIVASSPWIAEQAQSSAVFTNTPIEIIANPLRQDFLSSEHRVDPHNPYLLVVASDTSDPLKNIEFVVRVFESLRSDHPTLSLHIVGAHSSRYQAENIVCFESLSAQQLSKEMGGSLALLIPSLAETAPLVVAEAMATGTPVVASDIPSLRSMVAWVGAGDVAESFEQWRAVLSELAKAGISGVDDSQTRASIRARARMFDPSVVAQQYLDLYERIS